MNSSTATPALTWTAPVSSWWSVRSAKWTGRQIVRPFRFLKRHFWKISLATTLLITAAWQYENWHGRQALAEQRALWIAEYGEMKLEDYITPPVPDDENFFTAPIFEKWAKPLDPAPADADEFIKSVRKVEQTMPHKRFHQIACTTIENGPAYAVSKQTCQGLEILDLDDWEKQLAEQGKTRPEGFPQAAWLLSTLPHETVVDELIIAAKRPKSAWPMSFAERLAVAKAVVHPYAMPIQAISNVFDLTTKISQRARLAAQAGDGNLAFDLTQILWRFPEACKSSPGICAALVGTAIEQFAIAATTEALAAHCWSAEQMQQMAARLEAVNEEKMLRDGLTLELFGRQMWPVETHRKAIKETWRSGWTAAWWFRAWTHGPDGWLDCNMAYSLEWCRALLTPDIPGDDLIYLQKKMKDNIDSVRQEYAISWQNPRRLLAACTIPQMSNIADSAIKNQTRKRQLLFAIALERFYLKENRYPQQASELIPAYCDQLPGDPTQPGKSFQYQTTTGNERYRLISHDPDHTLAFPKL